MKAYEFKDWLVKNNICTTSKQVSDCVSRTKMVERKFSEAFGTDFDLDKEYRKDGLEGVRKALSRYGVKYMNEFIPVGATTSFPIGKSSMGALNNAILKYIRFKEATKNKSSKA